MTNKFVYLTTHKMASKETNEVIYDYLDQYELSIDSLAPYNCLVVTDNCDQEFLFEKSDIITNFLNDGKMVIFSGNIATPWLQGASLFVPKVINNYTDYEVQVVMDNPIYAGVEIDDMVFKKGVAGFFARGHHEAPKGADVYLTLGEGRPVTYVDRVSSNGTIIVHAGFDLFGYALNAGNMGSGTTADKIGPQFLQFCLDELEMLSAKKATTRRKIAVISSGTSHHIRSYKTGEFAKHITKVIPVRELATASFDDIDVLIVPSQTNMSVFLPQKHRIDEFADAGGIVVSFGHQFEEWLPKDVNWELRPTNFWWWLEKDAKSGLVLTGGENDLFKNYITLADATWHQHGVYFPQGEVESLVETEDGGKVFYIDRQRSKGTWIITTLDPDFHYGHYFMPATERFLRGFMPWLENGEI